MSSTPVADVVRDGEPEVLRPDRPGRPDAVGGRRFEETARRVVDRGTSDG